MNNSHSAPFVDSFETATSSPPPKPVIKTQPAPKKPSLPPVKPVMPATPKPALPQRPQPLSRPSSGLDWLEQSMTSRKAGEDSAKKAQAEQEMKQKDQLEKMKQIDDKRSRQMYEEIQQQIMMIRKKKNLEPTKHITGATGYDPEQHKDPETFWQKVKKKQEETKKKLMPWTSKQGMGTGEITRGVSG